MFLFFNDTATTEIYSLSLHDALPISRCLRARAAPPRQSAVDAPQRDREPARRGARAGRGGAGARALPRQPAPLRSEEHTSELQSRQYLVCRLLLEKKKQYSFIRSSLF